MDAEPLTFSVDSLLLGELGERLVTKNYIALAELIKNAYDADATQVVVKFINAKGKMGENVTSEIIVIDNGHGMTFDQIKEFWMRIATPNKLREPISPYYGRKKTGNKGIGRFACRRLAKTLILESIAENKDTTKFEYTRVEFDWSKYIAGELLTEIPNYYETKIIDKTEPTIKLKLVDLQDVWIERDFNTLRRQVLGLSIVSGVKRKEYPYDPGFNIVFEASEFEMGLGELSEQVMDAGWGRLKGEINNEGVAKLTLDAQKIEHSEFQLPNKYTELSGSSFDIAIIWRRKDYCRDPNTLTLELIDQIFQEWSGVRVYLEGFRVYPYGEPGNDWLEIDEITARRLTKIDDMFSRVVDNLVGLKERRPLLNHPRNQNLIGRVKISNIPNERYSVTMNREGLIEDANYNKLKEFIKLGLMWSTLYYGRFLFMSDVEELDKTYNEFKELSTEEIIGGDQQISQESIPIITSAINVIEKSTNFISKNPSSDLVKEYKGKTELATKIIKESIYNMERETNILRTTASTGALIFVFSHESKDISSRLETYAGYIERISVEIDDKYKSELVKIIKGLRDTRNKFDNQLKLFNKMSKGFSETNRKKIRFNKIYNDVIESYKSLTDYYGIDIQKSFDESLIVGSMYEVELYSILVNLISNAIKAVLANSTNLIKVEVTKDDKGTILRVYDNGLGLSKESRKFIFQPLVADPEGRLYKSLEEKIRYKDLLSVGEGSGLGLSIIKDIVRSYGKDVQFIDPEKPWVTCVEVKLP